MSTILEKISNHLKKQPAYERGVAVDFDGPLHKYSKGGQNGDIYDEVSPGCIKSLHILRERGYKIAIYTARITDYMGLDGIVINEKRFEALKTYLDDNSVPYDSIMPKMVAEAYIDDRAVYCNPVDNVGGECVLENKLLCDTY